MQFSIKPPGAFLWKTGYTEEEVKSFLYDSRITGDWLVCPLGEVAHTVTVMEFIENPSILTELHDVASARSADLRDEPLPPMSVAALGWSVFLGALAAHLFIATILSHRPAGLTSHINTSVFASTLVKGIDALILAGAITALLGLAYKKIKIKEQVEPHYRD